MKNNRKITLFYKFALLVFLLCCILLLNGNFSLSKAIASEKHITLSGSTDDFILYFPIIFSPPIPANWEQIEFAGENITDIQISTSPKRIFASAYTFGLFESQDDGDSWQIQDVHSRVNDIEIHQTSPETMYLATWSSVGVYQTHDGGVVWEPTKGWATLYPTLYSVALHPISDTVMFAGSGNWEFSGGEIYKTTNAGDSWYPVSSQFTNALTFVFAPSNTETIFAGTKYAGIKKSVDGGESWITVNNGLPSGIDGAHNISSLAFHPTNHQWLYAATSLGVFVSYDSAGQWEPLWNDVNAYALTFDPQNKEFIYVGTNKGVFRSDDNGITWSQLGQCGLNTTINQLTIDPIDSTVIWVGTNDGIWKCTLK